MAKIFYIMINRILKRSVKLDRILVRGNFAKNGADCYSKNGDAVTVPTWQS